MNKRFSRALRRKLHLGRYAVPVWTIGLAGMLMATVAGQAVGPVLAGSVQGVTGLTVSQTVVLATAPTVNTAPEAAAFWKGVGLTTVGAADAATAMSDEGTAFTVAIETHVGRSQFVKLALDNQSGKDANFMLQLSAPAGVDIEADGTDDAPRFARLNANTWLGMVATTASGNTNADIYIAVEPKDDIAPGFYTITGRIIQVAN